MSGQYVDSHLRVAYQPPNPLSLVILREATVGRAVQTRFISRIIVAGRQQIEFPLSSPRMEE
jgi:hypothetical protein